LGNSEADTGEKRGSRSAAYVAVSRTVRYKGFNEEVYPMQPRNSPDSFNVTNAPRS